MCFILILFLVALCTKLTLSFLNIKSPSTLSTWLSVITTKSGSTISVVSLTVCKRPSKPKPIKILIRIIKVPIVKHSSSLLLAPIITKIKPTNKTILDIIKIIYSFLFTVLTLPIKDCYFFLTSEP